ncbi:MAG: two-component system, response regulator RpfG [Solirubrobacteraceae bacterium]|nr:two-component system, response regulator RpfG [Solirubrobacteraceae bacterium]
MPDAVLSKPGRLDDEEWAVMRRHTTLGASILAGSTSVLMQTAEEIARTHHERWDGSGYPAGLVGEQIPLAGRISAVCDVFDALLSRRPYKEPWPLDKALLQLRRQRGKDFDPVVVDAFMSIVDDLDPCLLVPEGDAVEAEREPAVH